MAKGPAARESSDATPPRLVCFDLGGVVVRICRTWQEACARAGIPLRGPERRDATRAERSAAINDFQTGRIDAEAYARRISAALDGDYSPEEVMRVHRAWTIDEYPGIGAAIARLHAAGAETAALSNTNDVHWTIIRDWPALRLIRRPHVSHELGLHKPDPEIYREFERRTGRRGREILFFDDLPENVDAARGVGWQAVQVDHTGDTAAQVVDAARAAGLAIEP